MNVKQLREALAKYPDDCVVVVSDGNDTPAYPFICEVELKDLYKFNHYGLEIYGENHELVKAVVLK